MIYLWIKIFSISKSVQVSSEQNNIYKNTKMKEEYFSNFVNFFKLEFYFQKF
jgi:hypothetical protein